MKIKDAALCLLALRETQPWIHGIGESLDIAISALEKQIPKEVVSHNGLNETKCPKCDSVFGYSLELDEYTGERFDYCYECGQALKW